ncbi:MAG TPA: fatty acid desaturase family protein [Streptosporangiaceae bacterium]|nr:fatty acid desaturase family protein [Streptosporangiaceae bacterium]
MSSCRVYRTPRNDYKKDIPADIRAQIKSLHRSRDNWHGLFYLSIDWLVIAAAVWLTLWSRFNLAVYLFSIVVIASRQRALRSLLHEASHYKLLRNKKWNIWIGRLFVAFPLLEGVSGYLCAHCEHHRHLWDAELDPKRRQYEKLGIIRPRDPRQFTWRHLLRPLLLLHAPYNVLSGLLGRNEDRRETWIRICYMTGAAALIVAMGYTREVFLLWLVPCWTIYQVLRYWSDIADHAGLESDDPWQATRNWTAPWWVRQLLASHNANLHLPHHLYPVMPQHRIPELDRILGDVAEYRQGHHCEGFLFPKRPDRPSVIQDVLRPEARQRYQYGTLRNQGRLAVLRALFGRRRSAQGNSVESCAETCPLATVSHND